MRKRYLYIVVLCGLCLTLTGVLYAQEGPAACPALVETAITQVGNNCSNLERNTACYGYKRVEATFVDEKPVGFFTLPADRTSLVTLDTIRTAPLDLTGENWGIALLSTQANIPNSLPGQAVNFILLGDVEMRNAVPATGVSPVSEPIAVTTQAVASLHDSPTLTANILMAVDAQTVMEADAISADADWVRVQYEGQLAWVNRALLGPAGTISTLPQLGAQQGQAPMQAFYFTTGLGVPLCQEAPSLLAVEGPEDLTVELSVNGAEIRVSSFVTFQSTTTDSITMTVHEGAVEVVADGQITQAGQTRTAGLDAEGKILAWSMARPATAGELAVGQTAKNFLDAATTGTVSDSESVEAPSDTDTTTDTTVSADGPVYHVVQRGENLFRIALRYDTSVTSIANANNISNVRLIYVGQRLLIPNPGSGFVNAPQAQAAVVVSQPTTQQTTTSTTSTATCGGLRPTSPLGGLPYGPVTFYWDPAAGASNYRVNIYNYNQVLTSSTLTEGPETNLGLNSGRFGDGTSFYWDVEALQDGQSVCTSARIALERDQKPSLRGGWDCENGRMEVHWSGGGEGQLTISYFDQEHGASSKTVDADGDSRSFDNVTVVSHVRLIKGETEVVLSPESRTCVPTSTVIR